jgi:hypothetical protein
MPPLSHRTSSTPTESKLYLANSLAAAVSDPQPQAPEIPCIISHVPFPLLKSYQRISPGPRHLFMFRNSASFHDEKFVAPLPIPKLEDHPLSAVRDCLLNIFADTFHIGGRFSIRNLRTRHAVVTGNHLSIISTAFSRQK